MSAPQFIGRQYAVSPSSVPSRGYGQLQFSPHEMTAPASLSTAASGAGGGGYAGTALLATSAFSTMFGSLLSSQSAEADAKAIQAAAQYNATIAEMEGRAEEARRRHIARRALSSQFVQMAGKSGVMAEEGGWLEALVANAAEYEVNALNASIAGRNTAALERARGDTARRIGKQKSAAAIMSGVGQIAGMGLSLYIGGSYPTVATTG